MAAAVSIKAAAAGPGLTVPSARAYEEYPHTTMKVAVFVLAVVASASAGVVLPATTLLRAPAHDSAVIQSERLGGNFAYSSVEGHAYQAVSPVVEHVQTPVAVSYHATPVQVPVVKQEQIAYKAAPVVHTTYAAAAPVVHSAYAAAPVVSAYSAPVVSAYGAYGAYGAYNAYNAYNAPLVHSAPYVHSAYAAAAPVVVARK